MLKRIVFFTLPLAIVFTVTSFANNVVCVKTGESIPAPEWAKLKCNYHTRIIGVRADVNAFQVDTNTRQSGTYDCFIKFDVGNSQTFPVRLVDPKRAGITDAAHLVTSDHTYQSTDGQIITPAVYFEKPPLVNNPMLGTAYTQASLIDVLRLPQLTTSQIANALNTTAKVYSKYTPEVLRNLGNPIAGVFTTTGFIAGCKIVF